VFARIDLTTGPLVEKSRYYPQLVSDALPFPGIADNVSKQLAPGQQLLHTFLSFLLA
jgi:hypothetical protein